MRDRHMLSLEGQARALQTYIRRRCHTRPAPEAFRWEVLEDPRGERPGLRVARACGPRERDAVLVRKEGQPWCHWLGTSQIIAEDPALQAVIAIWDADPDDRSEEQLWRRLAVRARTETGARRLLREMQLEGGRILRALQPQTGRASGGALQNLFKPE
jgi:hypothetical protein